MISIVVVVTLTEKFISTSALLRKLEVKKSDIYLLKDVAKTAFSSIIAGIITFLFYWQFSEKLSAFSANFVTNQIGISKLGLIDFISGVFVLGISFSIFAPIYLICANYFGLIDEEEKNFVKKIFNNFVFVIFKKDEAKTL